MRHVTRDFPNYLIDIDTLKGNILVRQRWRYTFVAERAGSGPTAVSAPAWTAQEMRDFHRDFEKLVWARWSSVKINVAGSGDLVNRFRATGLSLSFDIQWVTSGSQHFTVTVRRLPTPIPASLRGKRSSVNFASRTAELFSNTILTPRMACTDRTLSQCEADFEPAPHEFGHTIYVGEDYLDGNKSDTKALMNVGTELRARYFSTSSDNLISRLNVMIPTCTFSVAVDAAGKVERKKAN